MTDNWFDVRYGHYHIWYTKYIMFEWPIDEKIFPISGCRWRNREKWAVRRNPNTEPARRLNSDTMSKIYFSYFKTYISKLLKLQVSKYHFLLVDFLPIFFCKHAKIFPSVKQLGSHNTTFRAQGVNLFCNKGLAKFWILLANVISCHSGLKDISRFSL